MIQHRFFQPACFAFGLLAATFGVATAFAQGDAPEPFKTPAGYVLIEEDLWTNLADEPGRHMDRAREAFIGVDAKTAASEIRKAAVHLRISAAQAAEGTRNSLIHSAQELESLAGRVEKGTVHTVGELDAAFARSLHSLSAHYHQLARESWLAKRYHRAGMQLRAATENLDHAALRAGHGLQTATREVVKDTRIVAGKLVEGTGFVVDEIGHGFEAFGRGVEKVGKGIEPRTSDRFANPPK